MIIEALTPAQRRAIEYSSYSSVGDNYYIDVGPGETVQRRTAEKLSHMGLVKWTGSARPDRYWLTEKGEIVRKRLIL